ncbi:hypothetical protein BC332_10645 [Capsicum chinense]|nr:hypothetical protein BC332_10645 [Capsicum chinense]
MQMEMEMEKQVMRYTYGRKERRKRMQNMFENLQALLPQLRPKNTVNKLKEQKLERKQFLADKGSASNSTAITRRNIHNNVNVILLLNTNVPTNFVTWSSQNVVVNVCGEEAHISVCCPKKPRLFSFICHVLEKHKIDIVSAQVSFDKFRSTFMIQTHARDASGLNQLISGVFSVEDMYKQAANEIISGVYFFKLNCSWERESGLVLMLIADLGKRD